MSDVDVPLTPAQKRSIQRARVKRKAAGANLEIVRPLSQDLRTAAATMGDEEARHLVDAYYIMQDDRKRSYAQERALEENREPGNVIAWLAVQSETLENSIRIALDRYTSGHLIGDWMRGIHGIGPVLAAGVLAHIYMGYWCRHCHGRSKIQLPAPDMSAKEFERIRLEEAKTDCRTRQNDSRRKLPAHDYEEVISCLTVSPIWSFAGWGADHQPVWQKGMKRPFNAKFRTLCWKIGKSFRWFSNDPECYYGALYRKRKEIEVAKNEAGDFAAIAAACIDRFGKETESYKAYATGKLPPAHLDARAARWATKLFLAHMHQEWYRRKFGTEPVAPYPMAYLGHTHYVDPPKRQPEE